MYWGGGDLATRASYVYVCDPRGKKVIAGSVRTEPEALKKALRRFRGHGLSVAIEAGNQTSWVYDFLCELGAEVSVVNPTKVKPIAESRKKTDKIDAKILCDLLRLKALPPPVHMPSTGARELRALLMARRRLVELRVRIYNTARGMLRQEGLLLRSGALASRRTWKGILGASYRNAGIPQVLRELYPVLSQLSASIKSIEKRLTEYAANDDRVRLLRTIPGVGVISALTFLACVDEIERFSSSRKLISYAGLAPIVRQSGERAQYGPINREGRRELRWAWGQVAQRVAWYPDPRAKPLQLWFLRIAKRRGKKTAIVALTRKLLTIAYHVVKYNEEYDPSRVFRAGLANKGFKAEKVRRPEKRSSR